MTPNPQLRVLFFDVFGTCVAQRKPVAVELWRAAQEALASDTSLISDESYDQWFEFGGEWDKDVDNFVKDSIEDHGNVDWREVDKYRSKALQTLLARRGLMIAREENSDLPFQIKEGSLWDKSQLEHLTFVWHRLPPWPDVCHGLDLLNKKFSTVTLSNTYNGLIEDMVAHSNIPFTKIFTSDMFQSFKPSPTVYLGAAEKMGVKPEECALVAAHLNDLKGAKRCGFYAIYVERPLEEKSPKLREENIPDLIIKEDEDSFISLAKLLDVENE